MRTPLRNRILPPYTRGQDIANMVTHIVGGAIGIAVLVLGVVRAAAAQDVWAVVGCALYGASMVLLYTVSSLYHGLRPNYAKRVFQVIDHCTIYLLIAGTYTPLLLCAIRPASPVAAWVVFGIEWGLAAAACTFTAIDHNRFRVLSMACYIGLGWCVLLILPLALQTLQAGFWWLLAGGIAYTVGAVLYGIGKKKDPVFHTVFHLFVVLGSVLQAVCVLFYL